MYNSEDPSDRRALASAIEAKLMACNFQLDNVPEGTELVYFLPVKETGMFIKVFTSIVNGQVRANGKDAIRVAGVYRNRKKEIKGITSETRVNRTGEIGEIVGRMYERMRTSYAMCNLAERCSKCHAPKFLSKAGNKVCAEICWQE